MHRVIEQHRDDLVALCREHHVRRLDVFGSAATGTFDPARSDIDLLVEFDPPGVHDPWTYFRLRDRLVELFGCEVDLVEPAGIRNDAYRRGIDATREPLYAAA